MGNNPDVFGEDLIGLAWEAVGVGATAYVNDKMVGPLVRSVVPGGAGNDVAGKLVDAVSTGVTGYLVGEAAGMVDNSVGRRLRRGGVMLAVAKGVSAFLPGFSLSGSLPSAIQFPIPGAMMPAPASNGASLPGANPQVESRRLLGVTSMGI